MNKNFDFDIEYDDGTIEIYNYNEESFSVSIDEFWKFVTQNGFHEYCNDFYDPREYDGHGQETGEFTREEYFDIDKNSLKHDLEIYLKRKHSKTD